MTTAIRRPITLAAPNPYAGRWDRDAACKGPARDRFFVNSGKAQEESRAHCRSCPVLDRCLTATIQREGVSRDRWGMSGGLTDKQRIALAWEQRLRGHGPDLDVARELLKPAWRYRLYPLRVGRLTPERVTEALRTHGLDTDVLTVRVVLWWLGGDAALVRWPAKKERVEWLADRYGDVLLRLRELGATYADVAAYLGVPLSYPARATALLDERAAQELEAVA
ncbi:WhiB family transcriptional regulator [Streptomyces hydrogenans]